MLSQNLFYPLIKEFDKKFFVKLKKAVQHKYSFIGDENDKSFFIKSLFCFQVLKDYRKPLRPIAANLTEKTSLKAINSELESQKFKIDYSWAVWKRDIEIGKMAEKIHTSHLKIIGTAEEFDEFVLRYLVSIWLVDWEGPLYALLQSTHNGKINLKHLNEILSLWDFTNIFADYK